MDDVIKSQARKVTLQPTKEQLAKRRDHLRTILNDMKDKGESITDKAIIENMKALMPEYDRNKLYIDKLNLKSENNFVSNLAIYTYSDTIESMFNDLDMVKDHAVKDFDNEKGFVRVNARKTVIDTVLAKEKILSGKALDVSVEMLGKKYRQMREELTNLKGLKDKSNS